MRRAVAITGLVAGACLAGAAAAHAATPDQRLEFPMATSFARTDVFVDPRGGWSDAAPPPVLPVGVSDDGTRVFLGSAEHGVVRGVLRLQGDTLAPDGQFNTPPNSFMVGTNTTYAKQDQPRRVAWAIADSTPPVFSVFDERTLEDLGSSSVSGIYGQVVLAKSIPNVARGRLAFVLAATGAAPPRLLKLSMISGVPSDTLTSLDSGTPSALAVSPTGDRALLAVRAADGTTVVRIYSTDVLAPLGDPAILPASASGPVIAAALHPDGKAAFVATQGSRAAAPVIRSLAISGDGLAVVREVSLPIDAAGSTTPRQVGRDALLVRSDGRRVLYTVSGISAPDRATRVLALDPVTLERVDAVAALGTSSPMVGPAALAPVPGGVEAVVLGRMDRPGGNATLMGSRVRLTGPDATLTVSASGSGGLVASTTPGIDCTAAGGDCTTTVPAGSRVRLLALPRPGSGQVFDGWGAACAAAGSDDDCTITVSANTRVTARFAPAEVTSLSVGLAASATGRGTGTVTSSPAGLSCDFSGSSTCRAGFSRGSVVMLRALPDPGSRFVGWQAPGCDGSYDTCAISADQARRVVAVFGEAGTPPPGPTPGPTPVPDVRPEVLPEPGPNPPRPQPGPDPVQPLQLTGLSLSRTAFRPGAGVVIRYTLNEAATVRMDFRFRGKPATRYAYVIRKGRAGTDPGRNAIRLLGRVRNRDVRSGRWVMTIRAINASGATTVQRRAARVLPSR